MGDNGFKTPQDGRLMKLVIVGHVDHGKSTLVGRLLADTDSLPTGKLDFVKNICDQQGKSFEFAFLLDALEEEQEQGITIDTSQIFFKTEKRWYVIIDAPGHKEFLKNMVTGAANAEAALLLIDAHEGVQEQSRRHGYILRLLGMTQVAVVINKMDLVKYDPEVYFRIKSEYTQFLESIGIEVREFIPISAKEGENVAKRSEHMPWYTGPTILERLDQFQEKVSTVEKPFRMPIQDVYKFDQRRIIAGRVESGTAKVGDRVLFSPSNKSTVIKSIETWNADTPAAVEAPHSVGITLAEQLFLERGEIISLEKNAPVVTTTFDANVFWMGQRHLKRGETYKLKLTTQNVDCEVVEFKKAIDASTLETLPDQDFIAKNDVAEVTLRTKRPVAFDLFTEIAETGRFVLVDEYDVCGGGIITHFTPLEEVDRLRNEARYRDSHWVKGNVTSEMRAYRNGHLPAMILFTGKSGTGKAALAGKLEEVLFHQNFQSYLLDGRNIQVGVGADMDAETYFSDGEAVRRFGEVAKLFLDAGHVVISTSNVFNQEDHSNINLLIEPSPLVEVRITDDQYPKGMPEIVLSLNDAKDADTAVTRIVDYLKEKKILTGHNYSI
ncbi:Sulfate adenylyltransferase, subunit 1, and adenylylsulfate kinase (bifunctional enzyme) [Nitrospina gracilis 3/211]|uniref:sulfate adenylyltransferase n=1 Tax=Nitrospina gracilis (strain 3/211) TaxID=1266370 RepID=M1YUT4_NITG3|nr:MULTISPECIES: GTP-binding protein [Nitrospina]MCF8722581.1 bifunctional enzyme CysN/CysC [Nitrospina sp. Nb-3]CCQ89261.1 Sulfate adenylyltransferase, subunit 1, and adenylylsulfate kinase (bifunctional enzyme) [Nitrospina gracilis 3/211]